MFKEGVEMHVFRKLQTIIRKGVSFLVQRALDDKRVQLEEVNTGQLSIHTSLDLLTEYTNGDLLTASEITHQSTDTKAQRPPARMDHMGDSARKESRRRIDFLVRLNNQGSFDKPREQLIEDIKNAALLRGEARPPHVTTVYRWRRRYLLTEDIREVFCKFDKQGGKGLSRLETAVEAVIDECIDEIYLSQKKSSAEEVHTAVFSRIAQINTTRVEREWYKVPGLRTIQRRIAALGAFDKAVARFGVKEAERRFQNHTGARRTFHILEIVEIDHTPVDLMVTDDSRTVIGRPTVTFVIDRFSRCVLGYHLSLAGHGTPAVFAALSHSFLPKTYLAGIAPDVDLEWDMYGWPTTVLMDNGSEFHSESVRDALANIGVITEFARSKDPDDKPYVERFIKTFNYSFIHRLPGTTLAKVGDRKGFRSEEEAVLTLAELDRIIHVWICKHYHLRPHRGLYGRTPRAVWDESAKAFPPQLKFNARDLEIEFSNFESCALQHYGVDLNTFVYSSSRLNQLFRSLPSRSRVQVKWPTVNAGHIWVWDPLSEEFFKATNNDEQFDGLTVVQAKTAKKAKASGDPSYRQTNADAKAINTDICKTAMADKKLKERRKGARLSNQTSNNSRGHEPLVVAISAEEESQPSRPSAHHLNREYKIEVEVPEGEV
jgi:putative transposase